MPSPQKIVFVQGIQEALYPDNEFYNHCIDDTAFIDNNKVNLAQAGASPEGVTNPTSFPLTPSSRPDSALEYTLALHVTLPTHVMDVEELEVNYQKRESVLREHRLVLQNLIAKGFITAWAPSLAASFVRTTGANGSVAPEGATGTRKKVTKADVVNVFTKLNKQDVPKQGRKALFPDDMYADLLGIDQFVDYEKLGVTSKLEEGIVGRLLGFDIMTRSSALRYNNAGTPVYQDFGTEVGAADNHAALFWHPQFVRGAKGVPVPYINEGLVGYVGSLMNFAVRSGGIIAREDKKGVVALIQSAE